MQLWNDFMDLIFPNTCLACGEISIHRNSSICINCKDQLPYTNHFQILDNELSRKLSPLFESERSASLLYFEPGSSTQKLIHQFKYHHKKELAYQLGYLIGTSLNNEPWVEEIEYLVPVPLHPNKIKTRGYNQSYFLAKGISECTDIPILKNSIFRKKDKRSQTSKSKKERLESVAENFEWDFEKLQEIKSIALIDDVVTTGATASACINSLPKANRPLVYFLSLAMDK
mgnify:CR=1 FL=1